MTTIMKPPLAHHPWVAHSARIVDIRSEVPHVSTYDLVFDNDDVAAAYRFKPGQFNMLYLPGYGESAISISSDPGRQDLLSHTVRVAGNVTQALARKRIGDHVALRGPFGSHWPVESCCGQDVVLACGGIGLAPLRPAIYHILSHRGDYGRVILLYGARTPQDLLYTSEYNEWRGGGIEVVYRLRLQASQTTILTCGPEIMMRFVVFEALARKVRPDDVFVSLERNMSCAMGFCGHCQLGPHFVCKDGPVFDFRQVEPYFNLEDL